jgi:glycosyltransferase involved in cell wall biosynthesis
MTAKLTRKKIVIVAGGYDINRIPSIGYGAFAQNPLKRALRRVLFRMADRVLAVSDFAADAARSNLSLDYDTIKMVYLPIAIPNHDIKPWNQRPRRVTFLIAADEDSKVVKGVDHIPNICRALPDVNFTLAGRLAETVKTEIESHNLKNLTLAGHLEFHSEAYFDLLNSSRIICAPSRGESFGAAVLDGALVGCYPIAFRVGSLPEVMNGIGTLVEGDNVDEMVACIREKLDLPSYDPAQAIEKISRRYSPVVREERLTNVLQEFLVRN